MKIKRLKDIAKEADKSFEKLALPIVFLDTSAIIDICRSARESHIGQNGNASSPLYETYADHFLMNLAGKYQTLISSPTHSEIVNHYSIKCNGNVREIQETLHPIIEKFFADYNRLKGTMLPLNDKEKYDVYWTTKLSCIENEKKYFEGFSEVDRDILENAVLFSKYFYNGDTKADVVGIISADEHLSKGAKMLNDLGYENIVNLSPRSKNGK